MKHFRARKQKSGKIYYYFDKGGKPRQEIPLGADYVKAVHRWAEIMRDTTAASAAANFAQLADKYDREVMPTKAKTTQVTQRQDLKLLRTFFCTPTPAPLDAIKPKHIYQLLQWRKDTPTTANRLKRLFSHMFNMARAWGYTERENPCIGIEGLPIEKRHYEPTDAVYNAIYAAAEQHIRDAMDLAYLTSQRPSDVLKFSKEHLSDGHLNVGQGKTKKRLRIRMVGEFESLIKRIDARKEGLRLENDYLCVNLAGRPMTRQMLRSGFERARELAAKRNPEMSAEIMAMWFYDLRSKAADDVAETRGELEAANLLGHEQVRTLKRHYLRRGASVNPTK